jgi:hypothetical protein
MHRDAYTPCWATTQYARSREHTRAVFTVDRATTRSWVTVEGGVFHGIGSEAIKRESVSLYSTSPV